MKKRGSALSFVMGLVAGIINALIALMLLSGISFAGVYGDSAVYVTLVYIVVLAMLVVNLIGSCIVRSHRIAGGVMMIVTALPVALVGILYIFAPVLIIEAIVTDVSMVEGVSRILTIAGTVLLVVELASIAAGVLALVIPKEVENDRYTSLYAPQESTAPAAESSFIRHYTAYRRGQDDKAEEDDRY